MRGLRVENLTVSFGDLVAVGGVTFDVPHGQTVALVGPSGCGKSTILRAIAGLIPYTGTIHRPKGRIAYMPQRGVLLPWYDLWRNLTLPLQIAGKPVEEETLQRLLEEFGLNGFEHAYPHQLSGGMYQRAALLRTILLDAPLMLLDEPFASVDALTRRRLWLHMSEHVLPLGKTTILVTHDPEEAVFLSDRVIVLTDRPARVRKEIKIDLPRPRGLDTLAQQRFSLLVEEVLKMLLT
jgi:NitT/TauT family transport system ATP-binding protein